LSECIACKQRRNMTFIVAAYRRVLHTYTINFVCVLCTEN